jgi:hypothetical protein
VGPARIVEESLTPRPGIREQHRPISDVGSFRLPPDQSSRSGYASIRSWLVDNRMRSNRQTDMKSKGCLRRATSLAILVALSCSCALLAAPAVSGETGVGPPPALAPRQAPPLPQAGPLTEPRSLSQVGFPKVLTEYVISPATLRPARVALGQL